MTGRELDPSKEMIEFSPAESQQLREYAWALDAARSDLAKATELLERKLEEVGGTPPSASVDLVTSGLSLGSAHRWEDGKAWANRLSDNLLLSPEGSYRLRMFGGMVLETTVKGFDRDTKFAALQLPMNQGIVDQRRAGNGVEALELGYLSILAGGCTDGIPSLAQKISTYTTV